MTWQKAYTAFAQTKGNRKVWKYAAGYGSTKSMRWEVQQMPGFKLQVPKQIRRAVDGEG